MAAGVTGTIVFLAQPLLAFPSLLKRQPKTVAATCEGAPKEAFPPASVGCPPLRHALSLATETRFFQEGKTDDSAHEDDKSQSDDYSRINWDGGLR